MLRWVSAGGVRQGRPGWAGFRLPAGLLVLALIGAVIGPARVRAACTDPYVVQKGDTLSSIADDCGGADLNYVILMNINPELENPDILRPGQLIRLTAETPLNLPGATGAPEPGGPQPGGIYLVRRGDSLARVAYLYHTTVAELYRSNPQLWHTPLIYPGQSLQLPPDARQVPGWVGVSSLQVQTGDEIEIRVVDFPPYTDLDFWLRLDWEKVYGPRSGDPYDTASYGVIADGRTDARGEARAVLAVPAYASLTIGKPWLVEVYASESATPFTARSEEITICGMVFNWTTYEYVLSCQPQE